MDKKRYLVIIVRPPNEVVSATPGRRPSLLVPFSPEAIISSFIDEVWKRLGRHDGAIPLRPETHKVSLHLEQEDGPAIDVEDLLSDVILDTQKEKIFAVFLKKTSTATPLQSAEAITSPAQTTPSDQEEGNLSFRIVTPSTSRSRDSCPILRVPSSTTVRQLHRRVANTIGCTAAPQETIEGFECNCTLASDVASGPSESGSFLVIHNKSTTERLPLEAATSSSLQQALFSRFGRDLETRKKITYHGATRAQDDMEIYTKTPVVSICSKQRHVPIHARVDLDRNDRIRPQVLDLHTYELPVHPACFDSTLDALGLGTLAINGVVDIFTVLRTSSAQFPRLKGKSAIYRDLAHWEPSVAQTDRGMAMFLSSLRVFASILQDMQSDNGDRDGAYYVFDELTRFPPALRCLHLLVSGMTPTVFDCAALSQSMMEVLKGYVAMYEVTQDLARLFEGSRLLFGFILELIKSLRTNSNNEIPNEGQATQDLSYTSAFQTYDVRDYRTHEAVLHAFQTPNGLIEAHLFNQLQHGGILAGAHLQSFFAQVEVDSKLSRLALQSGGTCPEVLAFSLGNLRDSYRARLGDPIQCLGLDQPQDLLCLAEMCSRHGLAVHGPSQLVSAVAPCLTFDRNAHLAVYTGEKPCAVAGHSSTIFRPQHGEETIDPSVMEQLIAPIIKTYEQNGSAVLDSFGDAQVRRLQDPDEIIMFCVDSSCSMNGPTDFSEVNEESTAPGDPASGPMEDELHQALSFEESKEQLVAYESFEDMVAIVATASVRHKESMAREVLALLASLLCSEIKAKAEVQQRAMGLYVGFDWHIRRQRLESEMQALKAFHAGLKFHEEALVQVLRFQASCLNPEAAKRWLWSFGDPVPPTPGSDVIPLLPYDITEVPSDLRCPFSHALMEDAVKASDGQTYSRSAVQKWFAIRKTSPLHGTPLDDLSLTVQPAMRSAVVSWISGAAAETTNCDSITVTFDSGHGSFTRIIAGTTSSRDLYKLAYRGLKAKFEAFQLSVHGFGTVLPSTYETVSSMGINDFDHIMVRIPEETDPFRMGSRSSSTTERDGVPEMCLVKVYEWSQEQLFSFWINRDTTNSLSSLIWKYWRYQQPTGGHAALAMRSIRVDVREAGDGWISHSIPEKTARLAAYLTLSHCTGQLEPETIFREYADASSTQSNHKVLKIMIDQEDQDEGDDQLSRLDVLKQIFEALVNRMLAYNYKNHVGLVKFSSEAQIVMPISHVLENFRRATNELQGGGDTALWDALALSVDRIEQYASQYPAAKKRIVVISDGRDTKSTTSTCRSIVSDLLQKDITIDSVSLGDEDNTDLRTLSYLCGSYRFHPTSLQNALTICEMEPFLSLSQRPPITIPLRRAANSRLSPTQFARSRRHATVTLVTDDTAPPIREHTSLGDEFVQLNTFASRRDGIGAIANAREANVPGRPTLRVPRLMNEIRSMAARGGHIKYDIFISTTDVSFWKIVVEGPDGSPYSDGAFLLYLHADEAYPRLAPKARFITKIKHPNVNAHGRICHSIFDRDWTSDTSMGTVLDTIYGLLYQPESSDPVNTTTTLGFFHDPIDFAEEARAHVRKHASKTREEWKAEILGEMAL